MGLRVAMLSGGKDSLYAAMLAGKPDLALMLVYEFPRPSPHLLNLGKSVETLNLAGLPVLVARLRRGRERVETVRLLQRIGASEIVAGDVYIEDHLRYMERVADEAGAKLREPLWGMDPYELVYREAEAGIEAVFIGVEARLSKWLGKLFSRNTVDGLVEDARRLGFDPLGERGEYHTVVVSSPWHEHRLSYRVGSVEEHSGYLILRLW